VLEVTESALAEPNGAGLAALAQLRRTGVRVAIDDFGTGYSSLGQLRALPVDIVKIDRSFIGEIDDELSGTPVFGAVIAMAHNLGLAVVAEGVETHEQFSALRRLGCDVAQGFLLSRPLPPAELHLLLAFRAPFAGVAPGPLVPGAGATPGRRAVVGEAMPPSLVP